MELNTLLNQLGCYQENIIALTGAAEQKKEDTLDFDEMIDF